jgi:lactoylglutathione lyase
MYDEAFPIISTPDLSRALGFYRDLLGGKVAYQFPEQGDPVYVGVDLGSSHLGIGLDPAKEAGGGNQRFSLWVYAQDCDQAVAELRSAGVTIVQEPADQPWGERIAVVEDPDGNTITIGQKARTSTPT